MSCTRYGGHPELSCVKSSPFWNKPCEPCELVILRRLITKAQKIILEISDGDVANVVEHDDGCPGDDTCECKKIADMNAVMGWERR